MVNCCVPSCASDSRKRNKEEFKLSFHEFPCRQEIRQQWQRFISNLCADGEGWVPHEGGRTCVCNKHFHDDDFVKGAKYRVLKKGAVPSIFDVLSPLAEIDCGSTVNTECHSMATFSNGCVGNTDCTKPIVEAGKMELIADLLTPEPESFLPENNIPQSVVIVDYHPSCSEPEANRTDLLSPNEGKTGSSVDSAESRTNIINLLCMKNVQTTAAQESALQPETLQSSLTRRKSTHTLRPSAAATKLTNKCPKTTVRDRNKFYRNPTDAIRILRQRIASKRAQICRLRRTVSTLEFNRTGGNGSENRDTNKLRMAAEAGDPSAVFLLDMVRARHMKHVRCSEITVRYCKLLRARFPAAYEFIRKSGLLRFPSRQTLGRYTGDQAGVVATNERLIEQEVLVEELCHPSGIMLDDCL